MKKIMNLVIVFGVLAIFAYLMFIFLKIKAFTDSFTFKLKFRSIDSAKFADLTQLGSNNSWVSVDYEIWIDNVTDFRLRISKMHIDFFYLGTKIGESQHPEDLEIKPDAISKIPGEGKIYFNKSTINFSAAKLAGKELNVDYVAKIYFWFIPFETTYKGRINLNKPETEAVLVTK